MKNFCRLFMFFILWNCSTGVNAQEFRIKTGLNMSVMSVKEINTANSTGKNYLLNPGFHLGGIMDIPVLNNVSFETALLLNSQGVIIKSEEPSGSSTFSQSVRRNLYYGTVMIRAKAPLKIGLKSFYISAGPYTGYGFLGENIKKSDQGTFYRTDISDISWGSDSINDLRNIDYGLSFEAGLKLRSNLNIGIMYNHGLENISPKRASGSRINNSMFGVSFSYRFVNIKNTEFSSRKDQGEIYAEKSKDKPVKEIENKNIEIIEKDSFTTVKTEQQNTVSQKIVIDSIGASKINAPVTEQIEKNKTDSVKVEQIEKNQGDNSKAEQITGNPKDIILYRVQFASNTSKKGSYEIRIAGKNYTTWEYYYNGAYRSTLGEFKTLSPAVEFQNLMRRSGHSQAFVVAFKNNIRSTDTALFK